MNRLCKACGSNVTDFIFTSQDRFYHREGNFNLYQCRSCGFIFIYPLPHEEELKYYYPDTYYSYSQATNNNIITEPEHKKLIHYLRYPLKTANSFFYSLLLRQNHFPRLKLGSTLLDVGCGDGNFLLQHRLKRFKRFGVDINRKALKRLKESDSDVVTYCGNLWEAGFADNYFDFINLSNVMEHISDYDTLLKELKRILKKEGIVRIQVPNSASLTYHIFGKYWMGLDTPRHLYVFSPQNLKKIFIESGFKILNYRTIENSYHFLGSIIYVFSALFRAKPKIMLLSYLWDNELIKLLFVPYGLLVNVLNIGDCTEYLINKVS
jgi:ubiquinone/menaquinone biosynthesis C-methylase UbiE